MLLTVIYEEGFSGGRVIKASGLCRAELPIQKAEIYCFESSSARKPLPLCRGFYFYIAGWTNQAGVLGLVTTARGKTETRRNNAVK